MHHDALRRERVQRRVADPLGERVRRKRNVAGLPETLTLLRYRASAKAALLFLDEIVPALHVIDSGADTHATAAAVFRRLAPKRHLSYCDAQSFVVVRHVLHDVPCLAFGRDFRTLGLTVLGRRATHLRSRRILQR